jgi:hypothetical protein
MKTPGQGITKMIENIDYKITLNHEKAISKLRFTD